MSAQDPLKFTSFLTEQAEDKWQSVIVTPLENYIDYPYKGRLFGVLSLSNESKKVDCISIGEILKDYLIDSFYEIDEPNIIDLLEETIHKTKTQLSEMIRQSSVIGNEVVDMECVLISVRDNVFYGATFGDSDVVLFNKNKKIDLLEFFKDSSGRNGVRVMSGILKDDDKLLLSITKSLSRVIEIKLLTHIHEFDLSNLIPNNKSNSHSCVLLTGYNLPSFVGNKTAVKHEVKEEELPNINYQKEPENIQSNNPSNLALEESSIVDKVIENSVEESNKDNVWSEREVPPEILNEEKLERRFPSKVKSFKESFVKKLTVIFSKENQTTVIVLIRKLLSLIKRGCIKIKDIIGSKLFSKRKVGQIYVRKGKQPNRIVPIAIGIVVIVIILVLGARQISLDNEEKAKTKKATDIVALATTLTSQAHDNATLNRPRALDLLSQANGKIKEAEAYGKFTDEINALKTKNIETQNIIDKVIALNDTNIFLDLGLKFPGTDASSLQLSGDKLVITDTKKQLYISPKTVSDFNKLQINDSRVTGIDQVTTDLSGNLIIFDSKNGLFTYSVANNKIDKLAGLSDVVVGPVKAMAPYKGGNSEYLYTIRNDNSTVYKLTKVASGYTQPETRLTDDAFASGSDIDIDGKIWVTTTNKIFRINGNTEEKYILDNAGSPKLPKTYSKIALSAQYVFVADNTNNKVLIFTKGASNNASKVDYVASISYQGVYGSFGDIIDLKVEGDKLYVLDKNRVYLFQVIIPDNYK